MRLKLALDLSIDHSPEGFPIRPYSFTVLSLLLSPNRGKWKERWWRGEEE